MSYQCPILPGTAQFVQKAASGAPPQVQECEELRPRHSSAYVICAWSAFGSEREMEKIKKRAGDDRMKLQQEMMALYKKEKVNPAAGCLPILLQIPIFPNRVRINVVFDKIMYVSKIYRTRIVFNERRQLVSDFD